MPNQKVAIITGAAAGIGRAAAIKFAQEGVAVTVADVNDEGGKETVRQIEAAGGKALFFHCDTASEADVKAMVETTVSKLGGLDYAFNNAGIEGEQKSLHEMDKATFEKVIAVNLTGVWLCMKYQLEHMVKQQSGAIVNNSSIAGLIGFRNTAHYVASKHGVIGLTKVAALESAPLGIRVNALCPGVIRTGMIERAEQMNPEMMKAVTAAHPMQRVGTPDEVAELAYWLCAKAPFITGVAVPIDGGYVTQ